MILLLATDLPLDELQRSLLAHNTDTTRLLLVADRIALVGHEQHLRSESGANELPISRRFRQQLRNSSAILGVEVGIDFVKEVERRRVRGLNSKDERKSTQT